MNPLTVLGSQVPNLFSAQNIYDGTILISLQY